MELRHSVVKLLVAVSVLVAPGLTAQAAPGGAGGMYTISVGNVQAQSIDANGKPTGTPQKIEFEAKGTTGCHLDADPKAQSFDVWVQGGVDNTGKLRAEGEQKQTGANDQITACARSVLINNPIHVAPGGYRVTAKVSFKPSKG